MQKLHYLSGLPRSGSTLLCNLLAQNPEVHATATSGLHEILYLSKAYFKTEEFRSLPDPSTGERLFLDFMKAGLLSANENITNRPVIIDKCRSWLGSLNLLFKIDPNAKVLVPVRDIRGVLSSMEKKFQQHPEFQLEVSQQDTQMIQTVEGRVNFWLQRPPIGIAIQRIHEANRLFGNKIHFVHFEKLTYQPDKVMSGVWEYLEMDFNGHDFNNVAQYTEEHELGWPYGEHKIRSQVKPVPEDWDRVLGVQVSDMLRQKFDWVNYL